jgi:hypothetical protein
MYSSPKHFLTKKLSIKDNNFLFYSKIFSLIKIYFRKLNF